MRYEEEKPTFSFIFYFFVFVFICILNVCAFLGGALTMG